MMSSMCRIGTAVCLVGAAMLVVSGCKSTPESRATAAASSMQETRTEIEKVKSSLDATVASLDSMVTKPQADLKPQFDAYSKAVEELEAQAQLVGKRAAEMSAKGETYFKGWEQDTQGISSAEIKETADARRAKLSEEYAKVTAGYEDTKKALDPLLASLRDIRSVLRLNLTASGLEMAGANVKTAKSNTQTVNEKIDAVAKELDTLAGILSGKAAAAK